MASGVPYDSLGEQAEEEVEEEEEEDENDDDEGDTEDQEQEDDNDDDAEMSDEDRSVFVGRSLIKDGSYGDALGKLSRYETTLMNNLKKALEMLEEARCIVRDQGVIIEAVALPAEGGSGSIAA